MSAPTPLEAVASSSASVPGAPTAAAQAPPTATLLTWHRVIPCTDDSPSSAGRNEWHGDEDVRSAPGCELSAPWKMLLFGDGSPTRLLGLLTGCVRVHPMNHPSSPDPLPPILFPCSSPLTVSLISMDDVPDDDPTAPPSVLSLPSPRVRRVVWLDNARGERLGYAASWWGKADADAFLPDKDRPIGGNMATAKLDVFRELVSVVRGRCPRLGAEFAAGGGAGEETAAAAATSVGGGGGGSDVGAQQDIWARTYVMWRGGRPLNVIYEAFSPSLARYMGPVLAVPGSAGDGDGDGDGGKSAVAPDGDGVDPVAPFAWEGHQGGKGAGHFSAEDSGQWHREKAR
jgi:chorismate lyase